MKQKTRNTLGAVVMGTTMVLGTSMAPVLALGADATTTGQGTAATQAVPASDDIISTAGLRVMAPVVNGQFSFDQSTVTSNDKIKLFFANIGKYQCGANPTTEASLPTDQWSLELSGDVDNAFSATLAELGDKSEITVQMGCTCAGNPVNGQSSINADVTGVAFETLMDRAAVRDDANTVTFISADGYSVSLPLSYVSQRYTILVYNINGAPLEDSVGGTNQLWLGSTSARYFARDIVEISFSHEQTPPPAPGSEAAHENYANTPNTGVIAGSAS